MYQVTQRIGATFIGSDAKELGEFKTFDEAHKFATENVCQDIYNEPHYGSNIYWFTDELNTPLNDVGYKVRIKLIKK